MTDAKKPEQIDDAALDQVAGGGKTADFKVEIEGFKVEIEGVKRDSAGKPIAQSGTGNGI